MECSESELSDILSPYIPWLNAEASKLTSRELAEDLAQEGLIAMWRGLVKFDPERGVPLDFYLKKTARWGMLTAARKNGYTGSQRRYKRDIPPMSCYALQDSDSGSSDPFEALVFSAHRQDIIDALNRVLAPQQRKFAILKFMYQYSYSELSEHFGYVPTALFKAKHKERLAQSLTHLKGLVDGSS